MLPNNINLDNNTQHKVNKRVIATKEKLFQLLKDLPPEILKDALATAFETKAKSSIKAKFFKTKQILPDITEKNSAYRLYEFLSSEHSHDIVFAVLSNILQRIFKTRAAEAEGEEAKQIQQLLASTNQYEQAQLISHALNAIASEQYHATRELLEHFACKNLSFKTIIETLEKKPIVDITNHEGDTILHLLFKFVINHHEVICLKNNLSNSIITVASHIKNLSDNAETLFNAVNRQNQSPLRMALEINWNNSNVVVLTWFSLILLKRGANSNTTDQHGNTLLHKWSKFIYPISEGLSSEAYNTYISYVLTSFLSAQGNINARNLNQDTPLQLLFNHSRSLVGLIIYFITNGADVHTYDKNGNTVFHLIAQTLLDYANESEYTSLVLKQFIIIAKRYATLIDTPNNFLQTPLHLLLQRSRNVCFEMEFIRLGANANQTNDDGDTILHKLTYTLEHTDVNNNNFKATVENILNIFRELITTYQADIYQANAFGKTPLGMLQKLLKNKDKKPLLEPFVAELAESTNPITSADNQTTKYYPGRQFLPQRAQIKNSPVVDRPHMEL